MFFMKKTEVICTNKVIIVNLSGWDLVEFSQVENGHSEGVY